MIIFHIAVAIASIILTAVAFFAVAKWALRGAYVSATLTLASGIYLVWLLPATMLHLCVAGVVYLAIVSFGIAMARRQIINTQSLAAHK